MKILYNQLTQQTKSYPRSDNEQVLGLDSDFLILNKINATPPEITETQSLFSTYVVDIPALEYRQQWVVIDTPPVANWDNFNLQMMSSPRFNEVYNQCLAVVPIVASALPVAIDQITTKGYGLFTLVWTQLCSVGGATAEDRHAWAELAENNNLPQEFIDILIA